MRIRTALTGLALGAASLFLVAPAAFASGAASAAPVPTSSSQASPTPPTTSPAPPTSTKLPTAPPHVTTTVTVTQKPKPVVVKPKGAAETGGGMETESTQGSGVFLVGGAALLAAGGVGAVGYRRFRRQS